MINVKTDGGAIGDGVIDDSDALQDLIDAKKSPLYFPAGRYRIEKTLTFHQKTGYQLFGCGMAPPLPQFSPGVGAESVIIWGGSSSDDPMIEYQGNGLVWSGISLWGCGLAGSSSSCPAPRAKYGININKPAGGLATGKIWFDSILIAHCQNAIGTESVEAANTDVLGFGYCWFQDCDFGLRLMHEQAVQYTFQTVRAVDVGTIFRVDQPADSEKVGGGRIFTQCVIVESSDTTVLDVKSGSHNTAYFQIGGVVIKESASDTVLLSNDAVKGGRHHFRFTNGHFRNNVLINVVRTVGGPLVTFTTLELVGCRGVGELEGNVTLTGLSNSNRVVFFVRDCDLTGMTSTDIESLIDSGSEKYRAWARDNWTFESGAVNDSSKFDPNP